tara:strand:- start:1695 stop:3200 length:1506 start_codon:yes stop_codon:yes gene_type:complete
MENTPPQFNTPEEEMAWWQTEMKRMSEARSVARDAKAVEIEAAEAERPLYTFYRRSHTTSIYVAIADYLERRGGWQRRPERTELGLCLHIGGHVAKGIEWGSLLRTSCAPDGRKPLCNFYRGFTLLCEKARQVRTIREHCVEVGIAPGTIQPTSFVIVPKSADQSERALFEAEYARRAADASDSSANVWILKPSGGGCGDDIVVESDVAKIGAFLDALNPAKSEPWVVSKYIERPLLVTGQRKFDIRAWVLVTADFRICLYREGVLRTSSVPYSLDDLSNRFVHLSNHCIQTECPEYGQYESTNEMWWQDFDTYLVETYGAENGFYAKILPQIEAIVVTSLLAVRSRMENSELANHESFQLFGYDFMVTDDTGVGGEPFQTLLIEVNSSPAVAADLMPAMVQDLVDLTIDPFFPLPDEVAAGQGPAEFAAHATAAAKAAALYQTEAEAAGEALDEDGEPLAVVGGDERAAKVAAAAAAASSRTWEFKKGFNVLWTPAEEEE